MAIEFDELEMEAFGFIEPQEEGDQENIENKEIENPDGDQEEPVEKEVPNEEEVADGEESQEEGEPDSDENGESSPSLYSSLAKVLAEEGLLSSLSEDSKVETVDDLVEAFRKEIKNNEYSNLNENQKKYLKGLEAGIPEPVVQEQLSIEAQLNSITPDELKANTDLRRQIILNDFVLKGYSKDRAEKLTQRSFDIGEDESDALDALDGVKGFYQKEYERKIQEAETVKAEAAKKYQEDLENLKKTITEFNEVIPGLKISEKDKIKVYETATKAVGEYNGKPINAVMKAKLEDPINFESKLNYLFYITDGFKNFNKVKQSVKTKAVKELDDLVKGNTFIPSGSQAMRNLDADPLNKGFSKELIDNII